MIRFVLKNHLRGVTALLIVNIFIFLSGCAGLSDQKVREAFYPEYFIAKKLDNPDIVKLRGLASSSDSYISSSAALTLGWHYLRHGDKSYGRFLIEKNYANPSLDPQMRLYGKLFKMESLISENDDIAAREMSEAILAENHDEDYSRVMKVYCKTYRMSALTDNEIAACVNGRLKPLYGYGEDEPGPAVMEDAPEDNMTYEEYLKLLGVDNSAIEAIEPKAELERDETINVIGGDVMNDAVQGMIFGISRFGSEFSVNAISEDAGKDLNKDAVKVYLDRFAVSLGDDEVSLAINWEELIKTATNLKKVAKYHKVIIASASNKMNYARAMKATLETTGATVTLLNYEGSVFQSQMRTSIEEAGTTPVIMIGIGAEDEIKNFIAIAKFLQNNTNQEILVITSALYDSSLKNEYGNYYKEVMILTPSQLYNDEKFKSINTEYESFFGKPMSISNILGYDILVYLNTLSNPSAGSEYISKITGFYDENGVRAYRPIRLYKFDKQLHLSEIPLEMKKEE